MPEKDEPVQKKNPLFEILNALFTRPEYISSMTMQQASQNIFMVNRKIAMMYPLQANVFNNSKVNPLDVMKFWSLYLYTTKGVPKWIYTSTKRDQTPKKKDFTNDEIQEYMSYSGIGWKEFDFAMKTFPEETVKEIKEFLKYMKQLKSKSISNGKEESDF